MLINMQRPWHINKTACKTFQPLLMWTYLKEMGGEEINSDYLERACNYKNLVVWTAIYGRHPRCFLSAFYMFSFKKYIFAVCKYINILKLPGKKAKKMSSQFVILDLLLKKTGWNVDDRHKKKCFSVVFSFLSRVHWCRNTNDHFKGMIGGLYPINHTANYTHSFLPNNTNVQTHHYESSHISFTPDSTVKLSVLFGWKLKRGKKRLSWRKYSITAG